MEYIEREKAIDKILSLKTSGAFTEAFKNSVLQALEQETAADVVEVVRCKDCIHAIELDKHCDINRTEYKHCTLLRGDETKYVWHKYKKYHKDYSIVEPNDYCSYGERKDGE